MEKISINELVALLNSEGYRLTRRSFWFYIENGIFPKPETIRDKKGVKGIYPISILDPMRKVLDWRDSGVVLKDLNPKLLQEIIDETRSLFAQYKYDDLEHSIYITFKYPGYLYDGLERPKEGPDIFARKELQEKCIDIAKKTLWLSRDEREKEVLLAVHGFLSAVYEWRTVSYRQRLRILETAKQAVKDVLSEDDMRKLESMFEDLADTPESAMKQHKTRLDELEAIMKQLGLLH